MSSSDPFDAQRQAATLLGDVIFALNLSTEHRAALQDAMGRWMHALANAANAAAGRAAVALIEAQRARVDANTALLADLAQRVEVLEGGRGES